MRARIVGAAGGARWLGEGWRLFRAAPLGWLALSFGYLFISQLLSAVPIVGPAAGLMLVPGFSLGLMGAARAASRGAPLHLAMLLDGFRNQLRGQLILGAVYLACFVGVFAAAILADDSAVMRSMLARRMPESPRFEELFYPLTVFMLLYAPVMMAFWFAPPLVGWHSVAVVKALFFSFFACLMNWRAFLAYGALTAGFTLVVPFLVFSVLRNAFGDSLNPLAVLFPLLVVIMPTLFASFYASYRDIFGSPE